MTLDIQIQSLVLSFLFGIVISFAYNIFYNILFTRFWFINILTCFLFSLLMSCLYYYLLFIVNDGIVHLYFLEIVLLSFFIYNRIFAKIRASFFKSRLN